MKPLIDCDILLYEIGFSSQQGYGKEAIPNSWDFVEDLLNTKIDHICDMVDATEEPLLYITNTERVSKSLNKRRKFAGEDEVPYIPNFRIAVAEEKEYKGTRKAEKPFHYNNLQQFFLSLPNCVVNEQGLEADDAMCIEQYSRFKRGEHNTVICSRDKDLWQCPGFHFSWEVGKQASRGPEFVDELGYLVQVNKGEKDAKGRAKPPKIHGGGDLFFYYQLLAGDTVDNIGGIKGKGPAFALELLHGVKTSREAYERVSGVFKQAHGEAKWKDALIEQAKLLWMVREVNEEGIVHWKPPKRLQ